MDVLAVDGSAWRAEFAKRAQPFRRRWRRQRLWTRALRSLGLPILALAGGLGLARLPIGLLPSPVAGQRAERAALRAASLAQADRLAALRRELVARPDLTATQRDLLAAQLAAAEASLRNAPTDRAA